MEEGDGHLIVDTRRREEKQSEAWHNIQLYPSHFLILVKAWPFVVVFRLYFKK